ncbi:hypothetical protein [Nostocoides sp. HKS02]|uniref:hypothetical protein n=1 Tax=Nostocoides sp. HKS02 TaxID=1813880 RepID=UPI0012B4EBBD|nr:hypothetical protein [Tetrasphaera sp. HKS02]QGN58083.1 hypothetical protein GKE56_09485 [Tetrasphaera sp. HKS02]
MEADPQRWGPDTAAVEALLARAEKLTQAQRFDLTRAYSLACGEGEHALLMMPRDYAWQRFHAGLDEHGLRTAFEELWNGLRPTWPLNHAGCLIRDAACATLLTSVAGQGFFRKSDLDVLLCPWRAVVDADARSRVALVIAHRHPYEVNEDWWAVVDAVLAPCAR